MILVYHGYRKKVVINELLEKQKDESSKMNEEKDVMLQEIHHRVKNNLQVVNSLLNLQSREIDDEIISMIFKECQDRILSMAKLHEQMYRSDNLKTINVEDHFTKLIKRLIKDYQIDTAINLDIDIVHKGLGINTLVPLGLMINEMISNSLKYAFKEQEVGVIIVHIKHLEGLKHEMLIGDNGVGMPIDFNFEDSTTLGIQFIQVFTEQLNGSIKRIKQPGTKFCILFENIDRV